MFIVVSYILQFLGGWEGANKLAAGAASTNTVMYQTMIMSAASAASRKTNSMGPSFRGALDGDSAEDNGARCTSLELGPLDLVPLVAALAADLSTA